MRRRVTTRSTTRQRASARRVDGLAPLGLHLTAAEVRVPRRSRSRSTSRPTTAACALEQRQHGAATATYLLQVGVPLTPMDAALCGIGPAVWASRRRCSRRCCRWWLSGLAALSSRWPARRAGSTSRRWSGGCRSRRGRRIGSTSRTRSTTRSRGSNTRWRDAAVQRGAGHELRTPLRHCAARSSWRCATAVPATRPARGRQPDRGNRPADAPDRPHPDAGARRVRADSAGRSLRSISGLAASLVEQLEPVAEARRSRCAASGRTRSSSRAMPAGCSGC